MSIKGKSCKSDSAVPFSPFLYTGELGKCLPELFPNVISIILDFKNASVPFA